MILKRLTMTVAIVIFCAVSVLTARQVFAAANTKVG
jgi:hypothetical protein